MYDVERWTIDDAAGEDGNWASSVPSAPSTRWNESWIDDGDDIGVWWFPQVRCCSRFCWLAV